MKKLLLFLLLSPLLGHGRDMTYVYDESGNKISRSSPDPFVQMPYMTQNFNRYSYALNNPLTYNDPDGKFFVTALMGIFDFYSNLFKHGFNVSQYSWKKTRNAFNIDMGMFRGNFKQILGKWTLGVGNSIIGTAMAHGLNAIGEVDHVTQMDGMLALSGVTRGEAAFTIGHLSFGPLNYKATWKDHMFVHEYGHYIQSQYFGPLYLPIIGSASIFSRGDHRKNIIERWTSKLGASHFNRHYGGEQPDENHFDIKAFRVPNTKSKYLNPRTEENNPDYFPF